MHGLLRHVRRLHHLCLPRDHGVRLVLLSGGVPVPDRNVGDYDLPGRREPTRRRGVEGPVGVEVAG